MTDSMLLWCIWSPALACAGVGVLDLVLLPFGVDLRVGIFCRLMRRQGIPVEGSKDLFAVSRVKQFLCLLLFLYMYQSPATGLYTLFSGGNPFTVSIGLFIYGTLALFGAILYLAGFWHFMLIESDLVHLFTLNPLRYVCEPRAEVYTDAKDWGDLAVNTLYIRNRDNRHTVFLENLKNTGFENMKNTEFVQPDK